MTLEKEKVRASYTAAFKLIVVQFGEETNKLKVSKVFKYTVFMCSLCSVAYALIERTKSSFALYKNLISGRGMLFAQCRYKLDKICFLYPCF